PNCSPSHHPRAPKTLTPMKMKSFTALQDSSARRRILMNPRKPEELRRSGGWPAANKPNTRGKGEKRRVMIVLSGLPALASPRLTLKIYTPCIIVHTGAHCKCKPCFRNLASLYDS